MPFNARTTEEIEAMRSCTCHPSERPIPCQRKFALNECRAAAALSESNSKQQGAIESEARCTYPECLRGGAHLPKGNCEQCQPAVAAPTPQSDKDGELLGLLDMYSTDDGFSHLDYRDTMALAARRLRELLNTPQSATGTTAEDRLDAIRYQWLRSASVFAGTTLQERWWELLGNALDDEFDDLIDTAMKDNAPTDSTSAGKGE